MDSLMQGMKPQENFRNTAVTQTTLLAGLYWLLTLTVLVGSEPNPIIGFLGFLISGFLPYMTIFFTYIFYRAYRNKRLSIRYPIGSVLLIVFSSGLVHIVNPSSVNTGATAIREGGGWVGYSVSTPFVALFTDFFSVPIFSFAMVFSSLLMTSKSFDLLSLRKPSSTPRKPLKNWAFVLASTLALSATANLAPQLMTNGETTLREAQNPGGWDPDNASLKARINAAKNFGKGKKSRFVFSPHRNPPFMVLPFVDDIGSCEEGDSPRIWFEIKINQPWPMERFVDWAIVTADGTLFGDSDFALSGQPNSQRWFIPDSQPTIDCIEFEPVALWFRMQDSEYAYESFYRLKSFMTVEEDVKNWSYRLASVPYKTVNRKPYFDF